MNPWRRAVFSAVCGATFLTGFSAPAFAHGVGYRKSDMKSITLEFTYSTGDPLSYSEAQVFSPQDEAFAWQSGRTDEEGRFAFAPNAAGTWRVIVRDGEGHHAEATVEVPPEFFGSPQADGVETAEAAVTPKEAAPEGTDKILRASLGVSLLFNIAAAVLTARRYGKRKGQVHAHR